MFPVCVCKFSSHYLNNIIFIDNSLGPLVTESPCIIKQSSVDVEDFQYFTYSNNGLGTSNVHFPTYDVLTSMKTKTIFFVTLVFPLS